MDFLNLLLTSILDSAHHTKHPSAVLPVTEVDLCAPTPKKVKVFFPCTVQTRPFKEINTKVFAWWQWLFLDGRVWFCLNGKTKGQVPLRLLFPLQGQEHTGLSSGHSGQFCGNPLLETGI